MRQSKDHRYRNGLTAQFALAGMGEEQAEEASWIAAYVSGISAYLYGTRYSLEQAKEELEQIVAHIKASHR